VHVFNSVFTLDLTVGGNFESFGLAITGTAAPPAQITTIPNSLTFGDVDVGSSATMTFELGDQGGFPLTIISSTPPFTDGFSALSNPYNDVIAPDTSIVETVQFAPTTAGPASSTWLLEGNDGNGVQTVTMSGTGVTPPPPPPPPPPPSPPSTPSLVTLTITTLSGRVGTSLTLGTRGDPSGGTLSYSVHDGTASGCAIYGEVLSAKSAGTCIVTATKAASGATPAVSSSATTISFTGKVAISKSGPVTIYFFGTSSSLGGAGKKALTELARELKNNNVVTCTGYAKSDVKLALTRANVVAHYLTSRIRVRVNLKEVSNAAANEVVVVTR
jgi:hypothetical protein